MNNKLNFLTNVNFSIMHDKTLKLTSTHDLTLTMTYFSP